MKFNYHRADELGKLLRGESIGREKILSPPWFQHCGNERSRCPGGSDAFGSVNSSSAQLTAATAAAHLITLTC